MATNLRSNAYEGGLTVDPSVSPGVPATVGAIFLRVGTAEVWQKTGAADTAWTRVVPPVPAPCQPFQISTKTIYARPASEGGNDATGDGTLMNPYRTFTRAVCAVQGLFPSNSLPPGLRVFIDITNVTEVLSPDYKLPAWKCGDVYDADVGSEFFAYIAGVNISATPRLMSTISASDATVPPGALAMGSPTADPVTGQLTYTLSGVGVGAPRTSWNNNALKGKLAVGGFGGPGPSTIYESSSTKFVTTGINPLSGPIRIMEPSAHLSGTATEFTNGSIAAFNSDSLAFRGIKITSLNGGYGLSMGGSGIAITQCCELESATFEMSDVAVSRIGRTWFTGLPAIAGNAFIVEDLFDHCGEVFSNGIAGFTMIRRCVFDTCEPVGKVDASAGGPLITDPALPFFAVTNTLIKNGTSHGLVFQGSRGTIIDVAINECAGDGIRAELGQGVLQLQHVRTSGLANGGEGIVVNDGMFVKADAATSAAAVGTNKPLTGVSGSGMKVGNRPFRPWSNYLSTVPVKDERDLTTIAGLGGSFDDNAAADAYVVGSGSRVYE